MTFQRNACIEMKSGDCRIFWYAIHCLYFIILHLNARNDGWLQDVISQKKFDNSLQRSDQLLMLLIDVTEKMLAVILDMEKGRLFDVDDYMMSPYFVTSERRCMAWGFFLYTFTHFKGLSHFLGFTDLFFFLSCS